ncbi:hypothetical protein [Streptomyces sp. TRM64462]|uniref:hypothetical protein n=1 Tax=Streptomyces sp. TRM64462 TaxID=2741726 RepID=UPI0015867886|nr:hypothetical protein [Streptomyces sp. TRM64462]
MPRTSARWCRVAAGGPAVALLALVLGVCGRLMLVAPAADAAAPAVAGAAASAGAYVSAASVPGTVAVLDDAGPVPGCGDGSPSDEPGMSPGTPPRGGFSLYELLPALYGLRATGGGAGCGPGALPDIRPERAPPALVPPSPMDLSILRV